MRSGSRKFGWIFRLLRLLFVSALFIASIPPSWASAQATADPWAVPVNLSHSGVTLNSAIVVDSDAVVHAVWQDDLANFVYTRFDEDQWSAPETTNLDRLFDLPIASESGNRSELAVHTGPNPLFIAGPGEHIFAFWITPKGRLFTSRVKNIGFKHVAAWDSERLITPDVVSFAVAVDELGELHLVFFRTADDPKNPPGIYYTRSKYSGRNWAIPMLLYESPYIRKLGAGEANLSIATTGTGDAPRVYVAWDNRSRKEVLLTQSADGGKSWDQPALVAGPAPDSRSVGPFNIHVGANQNSVVLVWQSGEPGGTCTQIYQSSRDEGATWSDPQPMIEDLLGCAESNEFVTGLPQSPESPLYFLTKTQSQVFLTAWNGLQWSHSQAQPTLSEFEDPEIYTEIVYGCHRTSLSGEQLYVIGCDQGGGGEAWVTSRDLGSTASWFEPPVWSQLSPVTSDNFRLEALELVATEDGLIHTFFSQHQDPAIYYTYWDGALWSRITPVLELPEGEAAWPAIAAGPGNELFLIAKSNRGMLYFSRATSGNAATASSWSTPAPLGIGHDGEVGSVDIAWDAAGTVYVAYALPVNEERGIYLVLSKDQGTTWSEPLKVFDGAAAGFDLIGAPSLLTTSNGFVHVLWKEQSIQGDGVPQPISLYYARSEDGGQTFNDAELVVEEPASWREIMADGQGNLHVLWQPQDTLTTVWDQVSLDGGQTWQFPQGLPDEGRLAAVTGDSAGRLHLVGVGPDALGHWLWDGSRWQSEVPLGLPLSSQQESPIALLAAVVNRQGKMMVVLAEPTVEGNVGERTLLYSFRTLDIPSKETNVQETPTETLSSPTMVPVTPTLEPLSTLTASVDNQSANTGQTEGIETSDSPSPFIMALVPVALLLLVVLGMVVRRASQLKDR